MGINADYLQTGLGQAQQGMPENGHRGIQSNLKMPPAIQNGRIFVEKTYHELGLPAPPISECSPDGHPLIANLSAMSLRDQLKTRLANLELRRKLKFIEQKTVREEVPNPRPDVLYRRRHKRAKVYEYCWEIEHTPLQDLDVFHGIGALVYGSYINPTTGTMQSNYMMHNNDIMATWQMSYAVDKHQKVITPAPRYLVPRPAFVIPVIATTSNSFGVGHFVLVIVKDACVDLVNKRVLAFAQIIDSKKGFLPLQSIKTYVRSVVKNSCWLWDDDNHGAEGVEFNFIWEVIDVMQQGLDSNCGYHVILNFYASMVGYNIELSEGKSGYRLNDMDSREFARDAKQMINCAVAGFIDTETILTFLNRWNVGQSGIQKGHDIRIKSAPIMRLQEPGRQKNVDKSFHNKGLDMAIENANRELQDLKQVLISRFGKTAEQIELENAPYLPTFLRSTQEVMNGDLSNLTDEDSDTNDDKTVKRGRGRPRGRGRGGRGGRNAKRQSSSIHITQDQLPIFEPTPSDIEAETVGREATPAPALPPITMKTTPPRNNSFNRPGGALDLYTLPKLLTEEEVKELTVWERIAYSARLKMSQDHAAKETEKAAQALQQQVAAQLQNTNPSPVEDPAFLTSPIAEDEQPVA